MRRHVQQPRYHIAWYEDGAVQINWFHREWEMIAAWKHKLRQARYDPDITEVTKSH